MGNSPASSGLHAARILRARVTNVDTRRYTVDVQTEQENRDYPNVQIGSPMYHFLGEGQGGLPDIGARCLIAIPSDDTPPTILVFLDLPFMASPTELEQGGGSDLPQAGSDEYQMSFAGAKPKCLPGDYWLIGRDGNFFFLRRGGTIQEGASAFCQRMYLRPRNVIRDFCENYLLSTVGIDLLLESEREADSDSVDLGTHLRLQVNELLGDTKATVLLEAGKLGDDKVLRLAVVEEGIDRASGSYANPDAEWSVKKDGTVDGVFGATTLEYQSLDESVIGNRTETIRGRTSLSALDSSEDITGTKRIEATTIQLSGKVIFGSGAQPICGNADAFYQWCLTHTHDASGVPVPPPPPIAIRNVVG
jgi:hypothetical protein